jgi:hypothetical protein
MIGEEADSVMLPTAGCVNGRLSNSRDAGCPQNAHVQLQAALLKARDSAPSVCS